MKDRLMAIIVISALVVSTISLAVSWASLHQIKSESGNPIPPEGFQGLGSRPGFGAGTFSLDPGKSTIIYVDTWQNVHIVTGTVTNEGTTPGALLNVTLYVYIAGWESSTTVVGPGDSITGTFTVGSLLTVPLYCYVVVEATGSDHVNGYYFGSFFPG